MPGLIGPGSVDHLLSEQRVGSVERPSLSNTHAPGPKMILACSGRTQRGHGNGSRRTTEERSSPSSSSAAALTSDRVISCAHPFWPRDEMIAASPRVTADLGTHASAGPAREPLQERNGPATVAAASRPACVQTVRQHIWKVGVDAGILGKEARPAESGAVSQERQVERTHSA